MRWIGKARRCHTKRKRLFWYLLVFFICLYVYHGSANETLYLYPIRDHGLWGYMNQRGNVVIEPIYKKVSPWMDGYAAVSDSNDRWGIIDEDNHLVLPICNTEKPSSAELMLIKVNLLLFERTFTQQEIHL